VKGFGAETANFSNWTEHEYRFTNASTQELLGAAQNPPQKDVSKFTKTRSLEALLSMLIDYLAANLFNP
jgi:hypothetical protein